MRKIIVVLGILLSCITGIAIATTVSTTDGKNYSITNDYGQTHAMSLTQINQQVYLANAMVQNDGIRDLKDGEALADWSAVQQMALNAQANWQANQTNGT